MPSVRIVAPIPGKTTVGIEVPNERRGMVKLVEVVEAVDARPERLRIPLFLGKDVKGVPLAFDLADMPHLLIAGRTGTGKSVCLNAMILSILMTKRPDEVKLILIDPKMVELSQFKRIPHLMHPVVTDMKKAESLLAWACDKMDERYGYLARAGVRNIQTYNQLGAEEIYERLRPEDDRGARRIPTYMPYIVIIADEMADLMMTAAKEVESHIVRLAQKSRAVGMHLIVATQKPTVDVITGLIKGNLPARIAFQVASQGDSPRRARRDRGRTSCWATATCSSSSPARRTSSAPRGRTSPTTRSTASASTSSNTRSSSAGSSCSCRSAAGPAARTGAPRSRSATTCTSPPSRSSSAKAEARARSSSAPWGSATAGPPG